MRSYFSILAVDFWLVRLKLDIGCIDSVPAADVAFEFCSCYSRRLNELRVVCIYIYIRILVYIH